MRLDSSVKEKYPKLTIGYVITRNVKVERTVKELEEEKQRVVNEVRDKYMHAKSEYVLLHFSVTTSIRCLQRLLQVHEFSLSDA